MMRPHTIFALSSGAPPAGLAGVRLSGTDAGPLLKKIAGKLPPPRMATRAQLKNFAAEENPEIIDDALVLWFPAPNS